MAQRCQRVGGFARLRDEQREAAGFVNRVAIAEFGGVLDLDGDARQAFEPIGRDLAGEQRGAAGDDLDALHVGQVEGQGGQR